MSIKRFEVGELVLLYNGNIYLYDNSNIDSHHRRSKLITTKNSFAIILGLYRYEAKVIVDDIVGWTNYVNIDDWTKYVRRF